MWALTVWATTVQRSLTSCFLFCFVFLKFLSGPRSILWSHWLLLFWTSCVLPHGFQIQSGYLACTLSYLHAVILKVTSGVTPAFSTNRGVHCISVYTAWQPVTFPTCHVCNRGRLLGFDRETSRTVRQTCSPLGYRDRPVFDQLLHFLAAPDMSWDKRFTSDSIWPSHYFIWKTYELVANKPMLWKSSLKSSRMLRRSVMLKHAGINDFHLVSQKMLKFS